MALQKILLVHLYSNGDCLYATALARQIKHDFPGCHLTWAVASFCRKTIANNPYVDEIMEIKTVAKDDIKAYLRFRKEIAQRKSAGEWDQVFISQILAGNEANYDGCIRSAIFRSYDRPVTVPVTPSLRLYPEEMEKVKQFAAEQQLSTYKQVILFEFAPQSGQSKITRELAMEIAEELVAQPGVAVILSSAFKINHANPAIIDGSELSFRETAGCTHYCTLLLGCSSGITWMSTSDAAKRLPMVQILNPWTRWVNPISRDFERFGISTEGLIELVDFDKEKVVACVQEAMDNFHTAKSRYHQAIPLHFRTSRNIVYNLLCYLNFPAILQHVKINRQVYGNNLSFFYEVAMGFIVFPFWLIGNTFKKKIRPRLSK
ncbi:hypothetical protein D3H65_08385 [Paraflavitalea soli]|uniref:Lipopolysaccharide heptosyltransferase family protein n=1 Tax=Paraflavitalea soli TaxID=2315862 RepID=A0A3B7ML46_9BACT|nr:hypothetical protein D3H65_08385 [Paraflavitalea soli]